MDLSKVALRKFTLEDIPYKISWVNDPANHRYLHYDLPLEYEKTCSWYASIRDRTDRYDGTIVCDGKAVGLMGLLAIDRKNQKAEMYCMIGNRDYLGQGIAKKAGQLLHHYAFTDLGLNKIYAYTEVENNSCVALLKRLGYRQEGLLKSDLFYNGKFLDRYLYALLKEDYICD